MKLFSFGTAALALLACSCSTTKPVARGTQYLGGLWGNEQAGSNRPSEVVDTISYFDTTPMSGPPRITINLTEQKAYFYKGNQLAGVALVATGKEGHATPPGQYRIMEKTVDKKSNLYGWMYDAYGNVVSYEADSRTDKVPPGGRFDGAEMRYWMRLTSGGVGMHQGPIPVPGQPASHGCIRVSKTVIQDFFNNASVGTPVSIVY